jgi:mRNA-degrading endonuclease RelE of RelBE toxin-antitoxin system
VPVIFTNRFLKAYDRLPLEIRLKVRKALALLDANPRHPSLQVHLIQGAHDIYEARVDRKYRMLFHFDGESKIMRNVDNHDECLRNP